MNLEEFKKLGLTDNPKRMCGIHYNSPIHICKICKEYESCDDFFESTLMHYEQKHPFELSVAKTRNNL